MNKTMVHQVLILEYFEFSFMNDRFLARTGLNIISMTDMNYYSIPKNSLWYKVRKRRGAGFNLPLCIRQDMTSRLINVTVPTSYTAIQIL